MNEFLCENLKKVEDNIAAACQKAGRDRSEVTLIAVSKTKPVDMLQTVYDQNIREFGENKVQEMCEKMEILPKDIHWHMIGHLQTNKVKYIVGKTALIHSVDSLHLAKEIEKLTGIEARSTTLGYIQRGGDTCPYDRILSTEYGSMAMKLAIEEQYNEMVTLLNGRITHVSLDEVAGKDTKIGEQSSNIKRVDLNGDWVQTAKRIGICLGDE